MYIEMASSSSKKSKSSGMRILWIPGRKPHSKGRYNAANKHIPYLGQQKKSEVWSLGGSRAQSELIDLPTSNDSNIIPSSSLSIMASCSLVQSTNGSCEDIAVISESATLPITASSSDSQSMSIPFSDIAPSPSSSRAMGSSNVITTVEIQHLQNFLCPNNMPKVPATLQAPAENETGFNSSTGTTASVATNSSPIANHKPEVPLTSPSLHISPQKNKYKNHNNNQEDINSIESLSSFPRFQCNTDFDWIDEMVQQRNCNELSHKNKRKKSKKALQSLETDQLDGKIYNYDDSKEKLKDKKDDNGDEKVVKCLYYSLMCCDCTIS
ncbi:M-phase inducer phosphatase isoform X3 [Drosophila bipectinata]|uniref:M-phase inducer phosphatase isoform X3 n=2 Tax=Drosophila bipectinata TaxID=42026 RepID=UPI0007E6245C|nr:uncharacterized protein LOC108120207 isoform X1 [Drosophila bipectinata]